MSVKSITIINIIEELAPQYLAEDWDNVGLLVGRSEKEIKKILLALDVTPEVVEEALQERADMIISHHPVIFKGLKALRTDTLRCQMLTKLLQNDIAVYCAHTNLDAALGGVSDALALKLGLKEIEVLQTTYQEEYFKLVVFVPEDYSRIVRKALGDAGAGHIGAYSHCTFRTPGIGTFKPGEGTNPFIGERGKIEEVKEERLETIVPSRILSRVIKAMIEAHPYEEVAYDLYPLAMRGDSHGMGRVGLLPEERTLEQFANYVKKELNAASVRYVGNKGAKIKKIAVCGGSGGSLIGEACKNNADLFLTGELSYHDAHMAREVGIAVMAAGHRATEQPVIPRLKEYLQSQLSEEDGVELYISNIISGPFTYV